MGMTKCFFFAMILLLDKFVFLEMWCLLTMSTLTQTPIIVCLQILMSTPQTDFSHVFYPIVSTHTDYVHLLVNFQILHVYPLLLLDRIKPGGFHHSYAILLLLDL